MQRYARTPRIFVLCLVLSGLLFACSRGPDASRPWLVMLDQADSAAQAQKLASAYSDKYQKILDGSAHALHLSLAKGAVRHLVVSDGYETQAQAQALVKRLQAAKQGRYPIYSVGDFKVIEEAEEAIGLTAPEEIEYGERMATWLPDPGDWKVTSFLLVDRRGQPRKAPPEAPGRVLPQAWTEAFADLGFEGTAEARYKRKSPEGLRQVTVLVGSLGKLQSTPGLDLAAVYAWLSQYKVTLPTSPDVEALQSPSKKSKKNLKRKKTRKRKPKKTRKRKKNRRRKKPAEPEVAEVKTAAPVTLPAPSEQIMYWGKAQVVKVEGIRIPGQKDARDAWISKHPTGGFLVALFDQEADVQSLMQPCGLGTNRGIAFTPPVLLSWVPAPEASMDDDMFFYLGGGPYKLKGKKKSMGAWANSAEGRWHGALGFKLRGNWWHVSWLNLDNPSDAATVFENGLLEPRRQMLKDILDGSRRVRYDAGMNLQEVGEDTEGWYVKGSRAGKVQEFLFPFQNRVMMIQASFGQEGSLEIFDMVARGEVLALWDLVEEKD